MEISASEAWTEHAGGAGKREGFDLNAHVASAMKVLEVDERLAQLRHKIVPQKVSEELFWRCLRNLT